MRGAKRSIWISQLALDADCTAYDGTGDDAALTDGDRLTDALLDATSDDRAVQVRILLNASLLLDTAKPLRRFFAHAGANAARLRIRGVRRFPQLLHAKLVIVDESDAFIVGSPFVNGYWDDSAHRPVDERRPERELGGRPLHDVSVHLRGPSVEAVATCFAGLWNDAGDVERDDDERLEVPGSHGRAHSKQDERAVRVVCTAPRGTRTARPNGQTDILDAMLDGIESARSLIYIEHQYLSARPIVDALVRALARERALEVILVLNQNPDVTAYRGWQNERFAESGLLAHPRVGIFSLWTIAPRSIGAERAPGWWINQIFVHSKVLTIDDAWATVGSANLDGVSLHSYGDDFSSALGQRVFRGVRNFDVNVVIDARAGAGAARHDIAQRIQELRTRLWSEHLGGASESFVHAPRGGWLRRWRERATSNVGRLNALGVSRAMHEDPAAPHGLVVLPLSTQPTPAGQLSELGVLLAPNELELRFNPSWVEVYCSPNWVRNMFL
jgi:phosphatidylserine/phosphatidylglycerophosphate/cardiolipin synthase-like enzyme